MLRAFSRSKQGRRARLLLGLLLVLLVAISALNVVNSYVGRDFMTALEKRAVSTFVARAVLYVGVFAVSTLITVFLRYTEETLALTCRDWLTRSAVDRYMRPPVYHRLSDRLIARGDVANPDERLADDIRAFTATSLSFAILLLSGGFTIVAFSGVLWTISPPLLAVAVLYAGAGSFLAVVWGRPLVGLNVAQLDKEANYRSELIHVRENALALAVARREDRLLSRLSRRIDEVVANFRRIIAVNRNLGFFTTGYGYLIQVIPALIVAPLFIRGDVEFGVIPQSAMAFAQLVGAFSLLVNQFQTVSAYVAVVSRLGALDEAMDEAESRPVLPAEVCDHHFRTADCPLCSSHPVPASAVEMVDCGEECGVTYHRLTLLTPADGHVLLKDLTGTLSPGTRLLILGPNDEARTALFRATAGTWSAGRGRVERPGDRRMLFLAERPYLPPGTLREVLTDADPAVSEERLQTVLRKVGLDPVVTRVGGLDVERRWDNLLSLTNQQLLVFAHALLSVPKFVFLDRSGTALGAGDLERMMGLFKEEGITVLSIGRSDEGRAFDRVLRLELDGTWSWK